jgi:DNA-directed RNA polymerase subunit M/transcription elongation factor TFIIS
MTNPICEECDIEMYPFAFDGVEGYVCSGCGWSFDTTEPEELATSEVVTCPNHGEVKLTELEHTYQQQLGVGALCPTCGSVAKTTSQLVG